MLKLCISDNHDYLLKLFFETNCFELLWLLAYFTGFYSCTLTRMISMSISNRIQLLRVLTRFSKSLIVAADEWYGALSKMIMVLLLQSLRSLSNLRANYRKNIPIIWDVELDCVKERYTFPRVSRPIIIDILGWI